MRLAENKKKDINDEYFSPSLRYTFEFDHRNRTPFIAVVECEELRENSVKIVPKPSNLFGYVNVD